MKEPILLHQINVTGIPFNNPRTHKSKIQMKQQKQIERNQTPNFKKFMRVVRGTTTENNKKICFQTNLSDDSSDTT